MQSDVSKKVEEFFRQYPERSFSKNQILIYAGDDPAGIYYLSKGLVRKYDITGSGNEIVLNIFKPPSFFPARFAVNRTPNRYFYETFTDVTLHMAPVQDTYDFLEANCDVTFDLISRLYSGLEGFERRMAYMMGGSVKSRIIFELILECKRFGRLQKDGSYILDLHESDLAKRIGVSRESVSRHISRLNHNSTLTISHKNIIINSLNLLEKELGETIK